MKRRLDKTSKKVWDTIWIGYTLNDFLISLEVERKSQRFRTYVDILKKRFGKIKGLKVIELGAGVAKNATLLAQQGAKITVMDFSKKAINAGKKVSKQFNFDYKFIQGDVLQYKKIKERFDVVISFGFAEHFTGANRTAILDAHFYLLKENGVAIIAVPNAYCFPYRIAFAMGAYNIDLEVPFTKKELRRYCRMRNINVLKLEGMSYFWHDFKNFTYQALKTVQPIKAILGNIANARKKKRIKAISAQNFSLPYERRGVLDSHFGYTVVLIGTKH